MNLIELRKEYDELTKILEEGQELHNKSLLKRYAYLTEVLNLVKQIEKLYSEIKELKDLVNTDDIEFLNLVNSELKEKSDMLNDLKRKLNLLMIPQDADDDKNVILEIRSGVGGEEACIFTADLMRMYTRYCNIKNWKFSVISLSESSLGIREVVLKIEGENVYQNLRYEAGVHRVQRIPVTESSGRIHTSAASVVVMPEPDDISIEINSKDIRIDTYRSSGHGGQSVNTTYSAVRVVHIPTGIIVTCQDTKSQHQNKANALSVLKARLYQMRKDQLQKQANKIRKSSIKKGDRSDKIKTYNFPQDRLTDHRIKKAWHGLDKIMAGEIQDILDQTRLLLISPQALLVK